MPEGLRACDGGAAESEIPVNMLKVSYSNTLVLLRRGISSKDGDELTVGTVLADLDDGGAGFLAEAFSEFRRLVVKAAVDEALQLGEVIEGVKRHSKVAAEGGVFSHATLDLLLAGVSALATGRDGAAAIEHLMPLTVSTRYDESLRWSAWIWMTAATAAVGTFSHARTAADTALTLAGHLDGYARAVSLATRSALDARVREADTAFHRIALAGGILEQAGHQRETSCLWLLSAQLLLGAGREREALRAASQAVDGDPDWARPAIFLARRAILNGRVNEAQRLLLPLNDGDICPHEVDREMRLVESVRAGLVPLSVLTEYLWMVERPITVGVVEQLVAFGEEHARQWPLHETIAWEILEAGHEGAAIALFEALLATPEVDQPTRNSAQLGLERARSRQLEPLVIGPLQLVQRYVAAQEEPLDAPGFEEVLSSPQIFWARRAIETGHIEEAQDLISVLDEADAGPEELAEERRFVEAIATGVVPHSVASEYIWIRERPATDDLIAQVRGFADEYAAILPLRLLMAWDLARDGYIEEANAQFASLLEAADMPAELRQSALRGLDFTREHRQSERSFGRTQAVPKANAQLGLSRFVWARQQWPSVLDAHPLLFIGRSEALPKQILELGRELSVSEGQHIHSQGKEGELLYCLLHGEAVASRARGTIHEVATITPGQFFGEIGTLFGLPNTASVIAAKRSSLLVIGRQLLQRQMQFDRQGSAPILLSKFKELYLEAVLDISPVCAGAGGGELWQKSGTNAWRTYQKGELIVEHGKPAAPALIVYGIARVYVPRGSDLSPVGYLCPGDLVGELRPSPVTVRAENTTTTVTLDRQLVETLAQDTSGELHLRMQACLQAAAELRV